MNKHTPEHKHTPAPWVMLGGNLRRLGESGDTSESVMLNNRANAKLIETAPELLSMLINLVELARDPDFCDFDADSLLFDAEILIARVTE